MSDPNEAVRRTLSNAINSSPGSREALEGVHGQVWDTQQLQADFTVHHFLAPLIRVTRKSDGVNGLMGFQHSPRFYFLFVPDAKQ